MNKDQLPIGYWLKKADLLLTAGIDNIQSEFGLSRTEWQLLNTIAGNEDISDETLFELLQPFSDKEQIIRILLKLTNANFIEGKSFYHLTPAGKQLYKNCSEKQIEFRQQAITEITEEQYEITRETLARLVSNLTNAKR